MTKDDLKVISLVAEQQSRELEHQDPHKVWDGGRPAENCLSYWYPKIRDAGLPVPKTEIVSITDGIVQRDLFRVYDGNPTTNISEPFFAELASAVEKVGYPAFLRTGQGSGKHEWSRTCFLESPDTLRDHVFRLIEWSECVDMFGLPWNVWAARELLPTQPIGVCEGYGCMPVCKEFRFFVSDGQEVCWHPYWPLESLEEGIFTADVPEGWYDQLCCLPQNCDLHELARRAGAAVGGFWSVDILETQRGWYVTDMALGKSSWHWPDCPAGNI